jgi:hypothetical protein
VRHGASWTAAPHLQLTAVAVVRPVLVVLCAELSWIVARPDGACPGGASSRHSASCVVAVIDTARTPAIAPVGVQHAVSTHPVSSSGIQRRSCGVRPSGVRPAGFVVRGSGGPAVRCPPSGVRPSAVRPVRPDASGGPTQPGAPGNRHHRNRRDPGGLPRRRAARSTAEQAWGRRRCRARALVSGGSVANLAGVVAGRRRPRVTLSDRAGQAGVRSARRCGGAVGTGAGCRARWPRLPRDCRPRVGWATTVGDGCGACRRGGRAGEGRWAGRRG